MRRGREWRELTDEERRAMMRVQRALAAVPDSIGIHFNESGMSVIDAEDWATTEHVNVADQTLDSFRIDCRYDTGAL